MFFVPSATSLSDSSSWPIEATKLVFPGTEAWIALEKSIRFCLTLPFLLLAREKNSYQYVTWSCVQMMLHGMQWLRAGNDESPAVVQASEVFYEIWPRYCTSHASRRKLELSGKPFELGESVRGCFSLSMILGYAWTGKSYLCVDESWYYRR